jgi:rubrerythrin
VSNEYTYEQGYKNGLKDGQAAGYREGYVDAIGATVEVVDTLSDDCTPEECRVLVRACKALHALLPEAPQEPAPTPEGETVMELQVFDFDFDDASDMWKCTKCGYEGENVEDEWTYCPGCGRRISAWKEGR